MVDSSSMTINQIGESMPGGFFVYYADGSEEIIYANDVVFDIFGCDTEEEFKALTGNTFTGLVYEEDIKAVEESIANQVTTHEKKLDYVEYRIKRKDGELRWIDDYGRLVHTEKYGDVFFVLISDITEKKQTEADKERAENDLEKQKNVNEVKSEFLFNISHDIRTPMEAIVEFIELAQNNIVNPEIMESYLEKAKDASNRLYMFLDDLMEMSKLDYQKLTLKNSPIDLNKAIPGILDLFRQSMAEKNLVLIEEVNLPDRIVMIDEGRFSRVLGNLVSNAVKFNPYMGVVRVFAYEKEPPKPDGSLLYEFRVEDAGVGIDEKDYDRIFEQFVTLDNAPEGEDVGGTGLGLYITKSIIEVMGGDISVKSKVGEGSVFTVTIPLMPARAK